VVFPVNKKNCDLGRGETPPHFKGRVFSLNGGLWGFPKLFPGPPGGPKIENFLAKVFKGQVFPFQIFLKWMGPQGFNFSNFFPNLMFFFQGF